MADILEYLVRVRGGAAAAAEMRGLAKEMDGVGRSSSRAGGLMGLAGKGVAALGAALVGVAFEAVKASTTFNHEMLRIRTETGGSVKELANMKRGVLDLASSGASMGQGPMSLAQGLYHVESLGLRGKKALYALKLSAQEAAISGASLEQTTSALGAAMFVGVKGAGSLEQIMALLNATVGSGNMRFGQLIESLGTGVLGSFKVAGLSIQDMGAAVAVLTDSGYPASSAMAQLSTALHFLYAPSTKAEGALASIGLSGRKLAEDMRKPRGLLVALKDLHDHASKLGAIDQGQVLNSILPGGRGRVLLQLYEQIGRLHGKYGQEQSILGEYRTGVALQRHDPTTQQHIATARLQARLVGFGDVLSPIVVPALIALANAGSAVLGFLTKIPAAIKTAIAWFHGMTSSGTGTGKVLNDIGSVASSLWRTLVTAFSGIASTAHSVFSGSFVKDLATIGGALVKFETFIFKILGPPLRTMITASGHVIGAMFNVIGGAIKIVAGLLTGDFSKAWQGIKQLFGGMITIAKTLTGVFWSIVGYALRPVADFLTGAFTAAVKMVSGLLNGIIGGINTVIDGINTVTSLNPFGSGTNIKHLGLIGSGGGTPSPAQAPSAGKPKQTTTGGHRLAGNFAKANGAAVMVPTATATATGWNGGDIVIKVGSHEFARIQRREIVKAMAAGA